MIKELIDTNIVDKNPGILLTAFGSFSADCVLDSLKSMGGYNVFGCDIYPPEWHAISKKFNKTYLAPLVTDSKNYKNKIFEICLENNIKYIFPLTDIEVDFFNAHFKDFKERNIIICIPSADVLNVARDKYELYKFFAEDDIVPSIQTFKTSEGFSVSDFNNFPYIGKPCDGRSSEGIVIIKNLNDLLPILSEQNYIIQTILEGPIYTVDYVRCESSNHDFSVARKELLRTKNGAGISVEIAYNEKLSLITSHIGNILNINGCVNLEFILNNGQYYLIDINPRFSAGVAFTSLAGYDMVLSHFNCFTGEDILPPIEIKKIIAVKKMVEIITSN